MEKIHTESFDVGEMLTLDTQLVGALPGNNQLVGKNRILHHIASGGIAAVYKVFHEELEVVRAIKMLKPGFSQETRERFQTEAKITANLHHANIVQIYNVDLWQNSIPYFEMEFVDGCSLHSFLERRGKLPYSLALSIAIQICMALDYAHNKTFTVYGKPYEGLVHRDIKPANILISKDGVIKLVDFGIALPGSMSIHTQGPYTMGTFAYLSPEQLRGGKLDRRSDIYTLGTVLYEMITGRKAYPQQAVTELIEEKLKGRMVPLRKIDPQIPTSLAAAIEKSLALENDKRFTQTSEFLLVLQGVLSEITGKSPSLIIRTHISDTGESVVEPKKRWAQLIQRIPWYIQIVISVAAFVVLLLQVFGYMKQRNETIRGVHIAPPSSIQPPAPTPVTGNRANAAPLGTKPASGRRVDARSRDELEMGLNAFKSRNWNEAVLYLENSLKKKPDSTMNPIALMRIFESYRHLGNTQKAMEFAEKDLVQDGYYYLLQGQTYFECGRSDDAETATTRAQTTRSVLGPQVQRDAITLGARIASEQYARKPNLANKSKALRAWQNVLQVNCKELDERGSICLEAEERIQNFSL
jgi:serine/threonine protein kinase